jgi:iron complex transport system substrate-binding protein
MTSWDRRALVTALSAVLLGPWRVQAATVSDGAGRAALVPSGVERIFPAGPPAAIFLYTLAPEREFLLPDVGGRPEVGALPGAATPPISKSCSRSNPISFSTSAA